MGFGTWDLGFDPAAPAHLLHQLRERHQLPQVHPPQQHHFEVIARLRGVPDVQLGLREQIEGAHEIFAREAHGQLGEPLTLVIGELAVTSARGIHRQHHHVAHDPGQLPAHQLEVVARLHGSVRQRKRLSPILGDHRLDELEEQIAAHEAEHRRDLVHADALAGERHDLVERALRVAHAPFRRTRDERQCGVGRVEPLGLGDLPELLHDRRGGDRTELEDLRPRQDRVRNLVQLRRCHHEDDVRGRLLDRLEQGVERLRGELMDLVDDEDLVAVAGRRDGEPGDHHLADVIDTRMAGRVDLEDVEVPPLRDLHAGIADAARLRRGPLHTVQRLRENPRRRRLTGATRAGKHERMRDAAAGNCIAQRARHGLLADDLVKPLRTPLYGREPGKP